VIIIVVGVAGSGKTTVGHALAVATGWPFHDGDDFHPPGNIEKMSRGIPLSHADRVPWLETLHAKIAEYVEEKRDAVFACSALTQAARALLVGDLGARVRFVYLQGDFESLRQRMAARTNHFFKPDLLRSQFDVLEEPTDAVIVDACLDPAAAVTCIRRALGV
jgi:gluconokinase